MTPSWSHQMNSIVFRPKRSWGRCWWLGSIQDFLRLGFWKKIHFSSLVNPMQERLSFLSCWQAEFSMCFGAAPSTYRSIHAAPIFRSFEPSPWHVAAWKWLLKKHPIARQAFFAIGYRPKEPIDNLQPSWADFHASCHSGQNCRQWTGETSGRCFR